MSDKQNFNKEYVGALMLPGEEDVRNVSLLVDAEKSSVSLQFESPVSEDSADTRWEGYSLQIQNRLKYTEGLFTTRGFPRESVEMTWKFNASHVDGSLAGVIIVKPNEHRITGEKGFDLTTA